METQFVGYPSSLFRLQIRIIHLEGSEKSSFYNWEWLRELLKLTSEAGLELAPRPSWVISSSLPYLEAHQEVQEGLLCFWCGTGGRERDTQTYHWNRHASSHAYVHRQIGNSWCELPLRHRGGGAGGLHRGPAFPPAFPVCLSSQDSGTRSGQGSQSRVFPGGPWAPQSSLERCSSLIFPSRFLSISLPVKLD